MSISDKQCLEAIAAMKSAQKRLKKCKSNQTKEIKAAVKEGTAASKIVDQYFDEEWERRYGITFSQYKAERRGTGKPSPARKGRKPQVKK